MHKCIEPIVQTSELWATFPSFVEVADCTLDLYSQSGFPAYLFNLTASHDPAHMARSSNTGLQAI